MRSYLPTTVTGRSEQKDTQKDLEKNRKMNRSKEKETQKTGKEVKEGEMESN